MKFKVGDKVEVIESPRLEEWFEWKKTIGEIGVISGNCYEEAGVDKTYIVDFSKEGNEYDINFPEESLKLTTKASKKKCETCGRM